MVLGSPPDSRNRRGSMMLGSPLDSRSRRGSMMLGSPLDSRAPIAGAPYNFLCGRRHATRSFFISVYPSKEQIKLFVTGSHNGCLTYVIYSNGLGQAKQERPNATGGIAGITVPTARDATGAAHLNAEHTEVSLNAKAKHCERIVSVITPPVTAPASICP